jgi:hypothetical protein
MARKRGQGKREDAGLCPKDSGIHSVFRPKMRQLEA